MHMLLHHAHHATAALAALMDTPIARIHILRNVCVCRSCIGIGRLHSRCIAALRPWCKCAVFRHYLAHHTLATKLCVMLIWTATVNHELPSVSTRVVRLSP